VLDFTILPGRDRRRHHNDVLTSRWNADITVKAVQVGDIIFWQHFPQH